MKIEIPESKKLVYEMVIPIRWGDMDALGHVNHALAFTYFEEARDAFLAERGISRDSYVRLRAAVEGEA